MSHLEIPQFDRPVEGRGEEQMGEVDALLHFVSVDACDWRLVSFIGLGNTGLASVPAC